MALLESLKTLASKVESRKTAASAGFGAALLAAGHIWPAVVVVSVGILAEALVDVNRKA